MKRSGIPQELTSLTRFLFAAAIAVFVGQVLVIGYMAGLPYLDLPNQLARAGVIGELVFNRANSADLPYEFTMLPVPYILGDLILAFLTRICAPDVAARIWSIVSLLAWPLGLQYYLSAKKVAGFQRATVLLASYYLAANRFFSDGILNTCAGTGIAFLALGLWVHFMDSKARSAIVAYFVALMIALCASYAMHFASFFFAGAILGVFLLLRLRDANRSIPKIAAVFGVLISISVLHFAMGRPGTDGPNEWVYRSLTGKISGVISSNYRRYDQQLDLLMFGGTIVFPMLAGSWILLKQPQNAWTTLKTQVDFNVITVVCLVIYVGLPASSHGIHAIDSRALPYLLSAMLVSAMAIVGMHRGLRVIVCTVILAASYGDFVYLTAHLLPQNRFLLEYSLAVKELPPGKALLPVVTRPPWGWVQNYIYHSQVYAFEGGGNVPYIFSSNRELCQVWYFTYTLPTYAPDLRWYIHNDDANVDWQRIAADYDYIITTKPVDLQRLRLPTTVVFENSAAVVLHVTKLANTTKN